MHVAAYERIAMPIGFRHRVPLAVRIWRHRLASGWLPRPSVWRMKRLALGRDIAGRDHRLSGRLRVTSSETLAYRMLTRRLAAFRQAHPGIVVELAIDEADIAFRPIRPKEGDLWGRELADVAWAVYGARTYLEANGGSISSPGDLGRHALIGWEDTTVGILAADWLIRNAGRLRRPLLTRTADAGPRLGPRNP